MSTGYLGEIRMFAGTFAPLGWWVCDGRLLPIAEYQALFAVLGTTYGGDGVQTFALPDLRGRAPVHQGQAPGLAAYVPGQVGGAETVTLNPAEMAAHSHGAQGASAAATATAPAGDVWAANPAVKQFAPGSAAGGAMAGGTIGAAGGGQPHDNMGPYLAVKFILCFDGVFPTRS